MIPLLLVFTSITNAQNTNLTTTCMRCAPHSCATVTPTSARLSCALNCAQQALACVQAEVAARAAKRRDALADEIARFKEFQQNITARIQDWNARRVKWQNATITQVVADCTEVCTNNTVALGSNLSTCTGLCNGITTIQDARDTIGRWIGSVARNQLETLLDSNETDSAAFNASRDALREAISVQRAFLNSSGEQLAEALEARKQYIAGLREARDEARDAVNATRVEFQNALAAATTKEERQAAEMTFAAMLKTEIATEQQLVANITATWQGAKSMFINNTAAFIAQRQANRNVIIADIGNLKGDVAALLAQLGNDTVFTSGGVTSMMRKRAAQSTTVTACSPQDPTCFFAVTTATAAAADQGNGAADANGVTLTDANNGDLNMDMSVPVVPSSGAASFVLSAVIAMMLALTVL